MTPCSARIAIRTAFGVTKKAAGRKGGEPTARKPISIQPRPS